MQIPEGHITTSRSTDSQFIYCDCGCVYTRRGERKVICADCKANNWHRCMIESSELLCPGLYCGVGTQQHIHTEYRAMLGRYVDGGYWLSVHRHKQIQTQEKWQPPAYDANDFTWPHGINFTETELEAVWSLFRKVG